MEEAAELYEDFTGHEMEFVDEIEMDWPDVAFKVGKIDAIEYETVRDGKREYYRHVFKKSARPDLGSSHDGKQLIVVGGKFRFTDRGIVDK